MYTLVNERLGVEWAERGLYGRVTYNNIIVDRYEFHLIMSAKDEAIILRADMTADDLLCFRNFEKK